MNNKYKEYIKYTILILCSVIFAIFTYKVVADKTIYIDSIVYNYISNNIINKNRTEIVKVITNITSPIMVIITLLILVLAIKLHSNKNNRYCQETQVRLPRLSQD